MSIDDAINKTKESRDHVETLTASLTLFSCFFNMRVIFKVKQQQACPASVGIWCASADRSFNKQGCLVGTRNVKFENVDTASLDELSSAILSVHFRIFEKENMMNLTSVVPPECDELLQQPPKEQRQVRKHKRDHNLPPIDSPVQLSQQTKRPCLVPVTYNIPINEMPKSSKTS